MFEKATRLKLRFASTQGQLSVEDLWDLPLATKAGRASLDEIAKGLFRQIKDDTNVSFVDAPSTTADATVQLKFDVVKHIIDVRKAENATALLATANREKKRQIMDLIAQKQNEQLAGSSLEDLMKMAEAL